jgi:uncharacterized membrane protein YidH (DUF202 family)
MTAAARDVGFQAQRTALSWRRTALSAIAVAGLFIHQAAERGWGLALVPASVAIVAMLTAIWAAYRRGRDLRRGRVGVANKTMTAVSLAVALTAIVAATTEAL